MIQNEFFTLEDFKQELCNAYANFFIDSMTRKIDAYQGMPIIFMGNKVIIISGCEWCASQSLEFKAGYCCKCGGPLTASKQRKPFVYRPTFGDYARRAAGRI